MFSQTVEYALRAVVHLADHSPSPRTTDQIAAATLVPKPYLSKVIQGLCGANILQSKRGIGGGIALVRPPSELTILDVVNAVEPIARIRHPTGRLIGKRKPYALNLDEMLQAAADYGCLLEINGQPSRLDLDEIAAAAAKQRGIPLVLGTDAHSTEELRFMEFGVFQARRAGLEAKDIANTRSLAQLRRLLKHSPV